MANPTLDVYVEVHVVGVDKAGTFDPKYVTSIPAKATAAAKAAFNGKKKTVELKKVKTDLCFYDGKAPDKKSRQYGFDANVNSITKDPDGNNFKIGATVASSVAAGTSSSMFGFASGSAKATGVSAKGVDSAVLDVATSILEDGIAKRIIPAIADNIVKNP